ncbi:hypothetical protein BU23DRAFT_585807 [Bimuria novae-zelandiae CBS 107.79]|uniref:Uncharacterized protein n=1 Tax=Bimuria novae-zelandiae CBS 107.79 TaxID=1447943 RepID=A0A6A5UHZ3_9PLEO|nr:hypothetical protein BU23DRAFT_585807 [Bimuria novae-zelandiae CBS 107.79]
MDEKGFLIGIIGRSKRVFSRRMWEKKEATSILPFNLEVILKRFAKTTQDEQESRESSTSVLSGFDWRKLDRLVRAVVENQASKDAQKLSRLLYHILEALLVKKKHKKKEYHGGAVLWSPRKVREAREQKLRKAEIAELRKAAKLYKEKIAEEKRVGREAAKKEARDAAKALQSTQKGKKKASQPPTQSNKRQKRVVDAVATKEALGAVLVAPPKTTRRGRNVKLPSKYK